MVFVDTQRRMSMGIYLWCNVCSKFWSIMKLCNLHYVLHIAALSLLWEPWYPLLQVFHRLNQGWNLPFQAINQLFLYQVLWIFQDRSLTQATSLIYIQNHHRLYSCRFVIPRNGDGSAGYRSSFSEGVSLPLHIYGIVFYTADHTPVNKSYFENIHYLVHVQYKLW